MRDLSRGLLDLKASARLLSLAGTNNYVKGGDNVFNKGFSILRHLQGKGCKTGLCGQAWSFPLFDPM